MSLNRHRARIGAKVEIRANSSIYRGELTGMSDTEVFIRTLSRHWTIPLKDVTRMDYVDDLKPRLQGSAFDFLSEDDESE